MGRVVSALPCTTIALVFCTGVHVLCALLRVCPHRPSTGRCLFYRMLPPAVIKTKVIVSFCGVRVDTVKTLTYRTDDLLLGLVQPCLPPQLFHQPAAYRIHIIT